VLLDRATNTALLLVPAGQLSLAIGKDGQNARLAAKLTGWRIDIKPAQAEVDAENRT
jgi:N utilization substance protein A